MKSLAHKAIVALMASFVILAGPVTTTAETSEITYVGIAQQQQQQEQDDGDDDNGLWGLLGLLGLTGLLGLVRGRRHDHRVGSADPPHATRYREK